jgi:hypothetical protein
MAVIWARSRQGQGSARAAWLGSGVGVGLRKVVGVILGAQGGFSARMIV